MPVIQQQIMHWPKRWNGDAKVILSVPCCQHELNRQIKNEMLEPDSALWTFERTYGCADHRWLRAEYLESKGYEAQILEFIDMEHTPKNILIRAVKTGKKRTEKVLRKCLQAFMSILHWTGF